MTATDSTPDALPPHSTASLLLTAALSGLLATSALGCSNEKTADEIFTRTLDSDMSLEEFRELCVKEGGWAYLTSSCAGSAMCKGLFLQDGTLTEHACRGLNSCAGAGCVTLPDDAGLTGKQVLETKGCSNCHAQWNDDYTEFSLDKFTLPYGPGQTAEGKLRQFEASSDDRLASIIVFGTQGIESGGLYFSNMPAYQAQLSLAEVKRTVKYIKGLPKLTSEFAYFGREGDEPEADAGATSHEPDAGATSGEADAGAPPESSASDSAASDAGR